MSNVIKKRRECQKISALKNRIILLDKMSIEEFECTSEYKTAISCNNNQASACLFNIASKNVNFAREKIQRTKDVYLKLMCLFDKLKCSYMSVVTDDSDVNKAIQQSVLDALKKEFEILVGTSYCDSKLFQISDDAVTIIASITNLTAQLSFRFQNYGLSEELSSLYPSVWTLAEIPSASGLTPRPVAFVYNNSLFPSDDNETYININDYTNAVNAWMNINGSSLSYPYINILIYNSMIETGGDYEGAVLVGEYLAGAVTTMNTVTAGQSIEGSPGIEYLYDLFAVLNDSDMIFIGNIIRSIKSLLDHFAVRLTVIEAVLKQIDSIEASLNAKLSAKNEIVNSIKNNVLESMSTDLEKFCSTSYDEDKCNNSELMIDVINKLCDCDNLPVVHSKKHNSDTC
jgi:hypothetical protein